MHHVVDGHWHQTTGQTQVLASAQRLLPENVRLSRHGGPLSQLLDRLGSRKILRSDVVQDAQMVLDLPAPNKASGHRG